VTKLDTLTRDWGYATPTLMVEDYIFDGLMPAICQNHGCDYSTEYEPDQTRGWCEACNENTVVSAAIMLGVI